MCAFTSLRDKSTYLKIVGAKQSKALGKAYESANEHNMGTLKRLISLRIQPHSSAPVALSNTGSSNSFKPIIPHLPVKYYY